MMKRADKIALLTKIIQGQVSHETRQRLRQSNGPGAVVITYQIGDSHPGPTDEVSFYHNGQQVTMPYKDIQAFTRYQPLTICMLPDNGRRKKPKSNDNVPESSKR